MPAPADRIAIAPILPWTDRAGRLSALKLVVFLACAAPGALIAAWFTFDMLGPKPVTEAIHQTGTWAIRFLVVSLAVTPLRRITSWPKLITIRRMVGLTALAYASAHLLLYTASLKWNLAEVVTEIVLRIYLTIGFTAFAGLCLLGITSTDGAVRRLGATWHRLHRTVYFIAGLAALHFFMQSKIDVSEATLMAGLTMLLLAYRAAHRLELNLTSPLILFGLAAFAGLATAAVEYVWYAIATGVPPGRVLAANLNFAYSVRPAWWVTICGAVVAILPLRTWLAARLSPA